MYLIALCDDETAELKKTEQMLSDYEKNHPDRDLLVESFESAEELLYKVREKNYTPDLILLDIYMPEKQGIAVARELRDMGKQGKIIFLTTSREHALDAFGVDAAQYLVKPVSQEILFPVLDRFLKEVEEERRKYIILRIEGKIQRVAVNDIVYCEAQGKIQYLYLKDGRQCLIRATMTEIYDMLACYPEFVRVGAAYIVNLNYVESLTAQELQMDIGRKIYLPRGSYPSLRERYFEYYCGGGEQPETVSFKNCEER